MEGQKHATLEMFRCCAAGGGSRHAMSAPLLFPTTLSLAVSAPHEGQLDSFRQDLGGSRPSFFELTRS